MTYVTDPIGDLITRIRNAQHVNKTECRAPWSKMKQQLLELLKNEEWIDDVNVVGDAPFKELVVTMRPDKMSLDLKRVSKPGRRVYMPSQDIKPVLHGFGIAVITTSKGLMTDAEARKQGVGGEVLCTIS